MDHSAFVSAAVAAAVVVHCHHPASRVVDVHSLPGRLDRAQRDFQSSFAASLEVVQAAEVVERNRGVGIGLVVGIGNESVGWSLDRMIAVNAEERQESDRDTPWDCKGPPTIAHHQMGKGFDLRLD